MRKLNTVSFKHRLLISNLLVFTLVFPLIGLGLVAAFDEQAKVLQMQTLEAYGFNLISEIEIDNQQLDLDIEMDSPNFSIPDSGLYAIVRDKNKATGGVRWVSDSLMNDVQDTTWPTFKNANTIFNQLVINNVEYFNWQIAVTVEQDGNEYPFVVHILASQTEFENQITAFNYSIIKWLSIIAVVLICMQTLWMIWFNHPIKQLEREISLIEAGTEKQVSNAYPKEIHKLTANLNKLINTEHQQQNRFKNKLSDLAHSLKTPLAIAMGEASATENVQSELKKIDTIISHQLKMAQGSQINFHSGCNIKSVVRESIEGFKKIYHNKDIEFIEHVDQEAVFIGVETDFYELLGNLLDNACKACSSQVNICVIQNDSLEISISDDGPGLPDQVTNSLFSRGVRGKTYDDGQGIGLAIVQDIVASYDGQLSVVATSDLGGLEVKIRF